jgi:predicted phosphate transport protein (TIGR00153 family)
MEKVGECVGRLQEIFDAYLGDDQKHVGKLSEKISQLEHDADRIKHDIHDQLRRGLFLPVDRERLLEILAIQDDLADKAEDIGVLLTVKRSPMPPAMQKPFERFLSKNLEVFRETRTIVDELSELLSVGFGGAEAERVRQRVMHVAALEFEADGIQLELLKVLFANEDDLSVSDFFFWEKIMREVGGLSDLSERLAHRIRRTLELK